MAEIPPYSPQNHDSWAVLMDIFKELSEQGRIQGWLPGCMQMCHCLAGEALDEASLPLLTPLAYSILTAVSISSIGT